MKRMMGSMRDVNGVERFSAVSPAVVDNRVYLGNSFLDLDGPLYSSTRVM